jgi:rhodanese-related sulfurtransferase
MGTPLVNRLLIFNALENQFYETIIPAKKETHSLIPANATAFQSFDYEWMCASAPSPLEIDAEEFDRLITTPGVEIIDVREPDEIPVVTEFKHIRVPLSVLKTEWKAGNNTIVVFCQSGKRSLDAAKYLSAQSASVFSLKGGIVQWKQHHQNKQTV